MLSTGLEKKIVPEYEKVYGEKYNPPNKEGIFRSAPTLIVVHSKKNDRHYPDLEDGTIAATLMEFQAQCMGLGSFWNGIVEKIVTTEPKLKTEYFGLPEDENIIACVCFGKPDVHYYRPAAREEVKINFVE